MSTICARNYCTVTVDISSAQSLPQCCSRVHSLYEIGSTHLCQYHANECLLIMPPSKHMDFASAPSAFSFKWEYDPDSGSIDYFSDKKTSKKSSERVLCLKPTDDDKSFRIENVFYNDEAVSNKWLADLVSNISLGSSTGGRDTHSAKLFESPDSSITKAISQASMGDNSKKTIDIYLEEKPTHPTVLESTPVGKASAPDTNLLALPTVDLFDAKSIDKHTLIFNQATKIEEIRDAFFSSLTIRSASDENIESCPSSVSMLQKPNIAPTRSNSNMSSGSQSPVSSPSKMILKSMLKPSASCETLAEISDVCDFIPILVSIEGNIGAGKSTLLKALKKSQLDWCFIDEPLDTWTSLINDEGVNLLELFYGDLRRWAYTFQNCAVLSRYQNIEKSIAKVRSTTEDAIRAAALTNKDAEKGGRQLEKVFKVFITERCLDTDYQVFAKMMKADGQFDSLEFDLYYRWYQLLSSSSTSLSAIVYVDTEPETCSDRIKCRNREGEEGIPVSYLKSLHQFQSNWINNSSVPWTKVCSTELDASVNFINNIVKDIASKY